MTRKVLCCFLCSLCFYAMSDCVEPDATLPSSIFEPTCRLHWIVHRVDIPNCTQKRLLSLACKGECESYTQYSTDTNDIERVCSCCQPQGRQLRRIRLRCRNPRTYRAEMRMVQVYLPNGCMCRPCSVSVDNVPDVVDPLQVIDDGPPSMDIFL